MIASLPMYDWPEVREATDAWWAGITRHLGPGPALTRSGDPASDWRNGNLLFSQTCGYPLTHKFRDVLQLVATPHYGADGCDGPNYRSIIFAREALPLESFRGCRAAVNTPDSMSGMLALKLVFAPLAIDGAFFKDALWSGGHLRSMAAVREGQADVCAIDAVCVGLARQHRPDLLEGLVEIARSPSVPGLPYVTRSGVPGVLRAALTEAFADPSLAEARRQLLLTGFSNLDRADYARIVELERGAETRGGLRLD